MTIKTFPNEPQVQFVRYTPDFSIICSIGQAPFHGTLDILYWPSATLLEFESFEGWLRSLANERMTIEAFCRLVFDALHEALGDTRLSVTVCARTIVHAPVWARIRTYEERTE